MSINEDELRRLATKATPGPWRAHNPDDSYCMNMFCVTADGTPEPEDEDDLQHTVAVTLLQTGVQIGREVDQFEANTYYIAAANPAAVLALLDTIAALRQELRTVIDQSNALVQRQRQEVDAANQRTRVADTQARYGERLIATAIELHHVAGAGEAMAFLLDEVTKGLASVEVRGTTDAAR